MTLGAAVQTLRHIARQPGPLADMLTPWSLADVRMSPSSLHAMVRSPVPLLYMTDGI